MVFFPCVSITVSSRQFSHRPWFTGPLPDSVIAFYCLHCSSPFFFFFCRFKLTLATHAIVPCTVACYKKFIWPVFECCQAPLFCFLFYNDYLAVCFIYCLLLSFFFCCGLSNKKKKPEELWHEGVPCTVPCRWSLTTSLDQMMFGGYWQPLCLCCHRTSKFWSHLCCSESLLFEFIHLGRSNFQLRAQVATYRPTLKKKKRKKEKKKFFSSPSAPAHEKTRKTRVLVLRES